MTVLVCPDNWGEEILRMLSRAFFVPASQRCRYCFFGTLQVPSDGFIRCFRFASIFGYSYQNSAGKSNLIEVRAQLILVQGPGKDHLRQGRTKQPKARTGQGRGEKQDPPNQGCSRCNRKYILSPPPHLLDGWSQEPLPTTPALFFPFLPCACGQSSVAPVVLRRSLCGGHPS